MSVQDTDSRHSSTFSNTRRSTLHLLTGGILLLFGCLSVDAGALADDQGPADVASSAEIEEITVTGSRIKRRDFVTPSPLTTISRKDIEFTGQSTLEDTLVRMPQILPGSGRTSNNSPAGGAALIDLRGLGPGRSLTLVNGRRFAGTGGVNLVDLNNIPQFLVERVEIISGGTSAVYGSDAISGVINFITRQDFEGFGVEAGMTTADKGDAETYDYNVVWGHNFSNGRGNLTFFANLYDREASYAADRAITSVPYMDDWAGNLIELGSSRIPEGTVFWPPADLGNGPVEVTFNPDGTPREYDFDVDKYNWAPVNYLQIPLDRRAFAIQGHYDLSERFETYVEASYIDNDSTQNLAPVPVQFFAPVNLDNPVLTPETRQLFTDFYASGPDEAWVFMSKRFVELGPRVADHSSEYKRIVAGVRGELWSDWEIDGWVTYTRDSIETHVTNVVYASHLEQGLLVDPLTGECYDPSGGCVPVDLFGEGRLSPEAADFLRVRNLVNGSEATHKLASVFVTGTPVETRAGPLGLAFGLEWRRVEGDSQIDERYEAGDVQGWGGEASFDGTESVIEIYAESVVPLISDSAWADYLELEIGGRYSDYDHAGGVWTYKAGGEWKLNDGLGFRAMHQRSVRAPNNAELFTEQGTYFGEFGDWDPCSASNDPIGNGMAEKCVIQGLPADQVGVFEADPFYPVTFRFGGYPHLEPEEAKTWTAGTVLTPTFVPGWTMSIDYFSLDVEDTIGWAHAPSICFDPVNTGNVFCENIFRDASGNISEVINRFANKGLIKTTGVDTQMQYQGELPQTLAIGNYSADINVNLFWTHIKEHKEQAHVAANVYSCAGYFGDPCPATVLPKDRVTTNVHYSSGPLGAHLSWRWIRGTDNAAPLGAAFQSFPDPVLAIPKISDENYIDLGFSYAFGDVITARLGISNLLDNDPPMMADVAQDNNTDTGMYDVFGRSYYLTLLAWFGT